MPHDDRDNKSKFHSNDLCTKVHQQHIRHMQMLEENRWEFCKSIRLNEDIQIFCNYNFFCNQRIDALNDALYI